MNYRPSYRTNAIDTTPTGPRRDRRIHHLRRAFQNALDNLGVFLWMIVVVFVSAEIIYLYGTVGR